MTTLPLDADIKNRWEKNVRLILGTHPKFSEALRQVKKQHKT